MNEISKLNELCQSLKIKINFSYSEKVIENIRKFKGKASIEGKTYETTEYYDSKKEAKHKVAKIVNKNFFTKDEKIRNDDNNSISVFENFLRELNINPNEVTLMFWGINEKNDEYLGKFIYKDYIFITTESSTKENICEIILSNFKEYIKGEEKKKELDILLSNLDIKCKSKLIEINPEIIKYEILINGIVFGSNYGQNDKNHLEDLIEKTKNDAIKNIRELLLKDKMMETYKQNPVIYNLIQDKTSSNLEELDLYYNLYIKNFPIYIFSTESTKTEKLKTKMLIELITEQMNILKKQKEYKATYQMQKMNNNEILNILNYSVILFLSIEKEEFEKVFNHLYQEIRKAYQGQYYECEAKKKKGEIFINLKTGPSFKVRIGEEFIKKTIKLKIDPVRSISEIKRIYIQFINLWSNLYIHNYKYSNSSYISRKRKEKIFNVLALYTWDHTFLAENQKTQYIYILAFRKVLNLLINYKEMMVTWADGPKNAIEKPYLIDPATSRNLIRKEDMEFLESFSKYSKYYLDYLDNKITSPRKFLLQIKFENNDYFSFSKIKYCIRLENESKIKTAKYYIPPKKKDVLNNINFNVFQSLQSYLLLRIINPIFIKKILEIKVSNDTSNSYSEYSSLNKSLLMELKCGLSEFFVSLLKNNENNIEIEKDSFNNRIIEFSEENFKLEEEIEPDIIYLHISLTNSVNAIIKLIIEPEP